MGRLGSHEKGVIVYDTARTTGEILTMLADAPAAIAAITGDLSPAQLVTPPAPGEWSARDVLAHLRACSDMWGMYILRLINEDRPVYRAVSPRTWIRQTDYCEQEFQPLLQAYTAQRTELLAVLKPLAPEQWSRSGTAKGVGKPRERTVYTYTMWLANHELSHLRQMERTASAARSRL
ncbi:MAG: DinB family protein [Chloroflexi bacterium]|jgi:hypothetical protein|nr:DinB family protein [Chloroflexota bacterium]